MIKELKTLLDSESGKMLKGFLLEEYNKLKNIENVKEYSSAADQALELKSQKKAAEKLREILSVIMTITEQKEVGKSKDDYFVI